MLTPIALATWLWAAPALADIAKPADAAAVVRAALALQPGDEAFLAALADPVPRFEPVEGDREFTGRLIVHPRGSGALAEQEAPDANVILRALARVTPALHRPLNDVGYVVITVPAGVNESQLAAFLLATGDYAYVEPDWLVFPSRIPNDPSAGAQYHHNSMRNYAAWDVTTGSPDVRLGIVDAGFETTHPDLAEVFLPGYNSVNLLTEAQGGQVFAMNAHGTLCAGLIAARGNNGLGVAGASWNTRLYPVRTSDSPNGSASLSDIQNGALWAAAQGARAVSVSYSGVNAASNQATGAAMRQNNNSLLVWAAGNNGSNLGADNYSDIIIVASVDSTDLRAGDSNWGALIDLCAPGVSVLTTNTGNGYASVSGTSFACPNAAGALGLIFSLDPTMSAVAARDYLFRNVDDLGVAGRDSFYGRGRVNSGRAVADAYRDRFASNLPFTEDFETETLPASRWVYRVLAQTAGGSLSPPSGTKALRLTAGSEAQTNAIRLLGVLSDVRLVFYEQATGAEVGEQLIVEYLSNARAWVPLTTITSTGPAVDGYRRREVFIPQAARSNLFSVRFRLNADSAADDAWFIDNVRVARFCAVDFNDDGVLNQEDLVGFLTAFLDESVPAGPAGTTQAPCPGAPAPYDLLGYAADFNRDCGFDQEDLGGFVTEFFGQSENPNGCTPG